MSEQYCIKKGYQPNTRVMTFEGDETGTFWDPSRIERNAVCQYYVYEKSLKLFKKYGYSTLLDVGCGPALKTRQLFVSCCETITLIDQPSVAGIVGKILPRSEFIPANLESIDCVLPRKYDLIICSDVLEHLLNPDNCMRFVRHHLAPKGLLLLSTPERDYLRGTHCNYSPKPEHIREWNRAEFKNYAERHGFQVRAQLLLPPLKLRQLEFLASRLVPHVMWSQFQFFRHRWGSCQVLLCTSSNHT